MLTTSRGFMGGSGLRLMDYGLYGSFVALHIPGLVGGTLLGNQHL
jgi:hypothetical protein